MVNAWMEFPRCGWTPAADAVASGRTEWERRRANQAIARGGGSGGMTGTEMDRESTAGIAADAGGRNRGAGTTGGTAGSIASVPSGPWPLQLRANIPTTQRTVGSSAGFFLAQQLFVGFAVEQHDSGSVVRIAFLPVEQQHAADALSAVVRQPHVAPPQRVRWADVFAITGKPTAETI